MTIKQEDFTNRALALLLQAQGLAADYEQRGGRKKMDVVVDVEGLRVVLEAETGFHRKAQAIKDADARLRQRLTTVVFAVCYPDGVTEDNLTRTMRRPWACCWSRTCCGDTTSTSRRRTWQRVRWECYRPPPSSTG